MAMPAHMTLEGENQGVIDGSCEMQGRENTILVDAFHHEVRNPPDPQSGPAPGKRGSTGPPPRAESAHGDGAAGRPL